MCIGPILQRGLRHGERGGERGQRIERGQREIILRGQTHAQRRQRFGWLGAVNYGVIVSNDVDKLLGGPQRAVVSG